MPGLSRDPDTVRAVSTSSESLEEGRVVRQAVTLVFGLVVVCGLLFVSVLTLGQAWLGVLFGAIELVVAWRVTPPEGARSLRWITGMFGAFTLAFSVLWLILS
jgi:hypothetical protein